jgi:hypothetical protein
MNDWHIIKTAGYRRKGGVRLKTYVLVGLFLVATLAFNSVAQAVPVILNSRYIANQVTTYWIPLNQNGNSVTGQWQDHRLIGTLTQLPNGRYVLDGKWGMIQAADVNLHWPFQFIFTSDGNCIIGGYWDCCGSSPSSPSYNRRAVTSGYREGYSASCPR